MAAESCDITLGNSSAEWKAEPHRHLHSRAAAFSATCKHPLMCKTPPLDFPQSCRDETSVGGGERDGAASVDRLTFCQRSEGKSSVAGPKGAPRTARTFTLQSKDTGGRTLLWRCVRLHSSGRYRQSRHGLLRARSNRSDKLGHVHNICKCSRRAIEVVVTRGLQCCERRPCESRHFACSSVCDVAKQINKHTKINCVDGLSAVDNMEMELSRECWHAEG